jgi:UDP-GlcNAc:undecaprenyl-phosphate/decaprenyl-phosphate GlcNAc-1-phosphate transferase
MHRGLHVGMYEALHDVLARALLAAAAAIVLGVVLMPLCRAIAVRAGLVDRPRGRKAHARPTPLIGGLLILLATVPVAVFLEPMTPQLRGLAVATALLLTAGLIDDLIDLRWYYRFAVQVAAALILIYVGGVRVEHLGAVFGLPDASLGVISPLFTVVATVGLINAVNMADGVDGVAGVVVLAALLMFSAAAVYAGNARLADGLVLLFGAVTAFVFFNLRTPWNPQAQIFLGSGAEVLGLAIAYASFRLTQNGYHPVAPVLAPFLIAPPVIDCLVLFVRRVRRGRLPFSADRNHMHHLLIDAGFSPTAIALIVSGASLSIGLLAALAMKAHVAQPWFLVAFLGLTLGYFIFSHDRKRAVARLASIRLRLPSARIHQPAVLELEDADIEQTVQE